METNHIVLSKVAEQLGLFIRNCGNGHFKIEGGKYEVSFYPKSKKQTLYFRCQGMSAKYHGGTWEMALELANKLPNENEAKVWAHEKSKRGSYKWAKRILLKRRPNCYLCGASLNQTTATIDHFIPLSKGGRNDLENLRLACGPCNKDKGSSLYEAQR